MSKGYKVVNEDGSLVPWLQQAEDRGLIEDGDIRLDEETHAMYLEWITEMESKDDNR